MLSTKLLPTFPHIYAFNISYLFVCRFGLTHRGRQTYTHTHAHRCCDSSFLQFISVERGRRRGSLVVLPIVDDEAELTF